jgi:hypothetical protein
VSGGAPVAGSLLAAALLAAGGLALADLVPALRARALLPRVGWAWILGCAWLGGSSYAASHALHVPLRRGAVLTLALLPVFVGGWRRVRGGAAPHAARPRWTRAERGLGAVLLAVGALVTASLVADGLAVPVTDWDGKMIWTAQARFIRGARSVDAPALRDPSAWVIHPRYPVLLPVLQVAVQEVADAPWDDRFVRPLYALFWPAFLLVLFDAASERAGRLAALAAALAASCAPFLASFGAGSACSDLPLACFWGGGLLLLLSDGAGLAEGAASGLLLGAGALSKVEGLPLAGAALVAAMGWALAARRPGPFRAAFPRPSRASRPRRSSSRRGAPGSRRATTWASSSLSPWRRSDRERRNGSRRRCAPARTPWRTARSGDSRGFSSRSASASARDASHDSPRCPSPSRSPAPSRSTRRPTRSPCGPPPCSCRSRGTAS